MTVRKLFSCLLRILLMVGGLVFAIYGTAILLTLDQLVWGKMSAASRDTLSASLFILIGLASFFYGLCIVGNDAE